MRFFFTCSLILLAALLALTALLERCYAAETPPAAPTDAQPADKPEDKPADQPKEEEKLTYKYEGKTITAIDSTGADKWKQNVPNDIVSVVFQGDLLMALTKSEAVAFTPLKGLQRWTYRMADIAKVEPHDTTIIFSSAAQVSVVSAESGREIWRFRPLEPVTSYAILDDRFMIVTSEKHVAAFSYDKGEQIANPYIDPKDKFLDAQVFGPVMLLRFEKEVKLWNTARKQGLPEIKSRTIEQMRDGDLQQALGDLGDRVAASQADDKAAGLVLLTLAKDKDGKLLLAAGLESDDDATAGAAQNVLAAMVEYVHGKDDFLRTTANGVLEQLVANDSGGSIEKDFYTAYYTKYSYELPDPAQTLTALVTMLRFGDKNTREYAIRTLESLTDKTFEFKSGDSLRLRNEAVGRWQKWLGDNQSKLVWDIPGRKIKIRE